MFSSQWLYLNYVLLVAMGLEEQSLGNLQLLVPLHLGFLVGGSGE